MTTLKNTEHIVNRKNAANAAFSRVDLLGFSSCKVGSKMKAMLFKVYIRPGLMHGIENMTLTRGEIKIIKKRERNIVRQMTGVQIRCVTKSLLRAYSIKIKIEFYHCLASNEFTNKILLVRKHQQQKIIYR